MAPLFGAVISNKLATLNELRTVYKYSDVLALHDIIKVDNYNNLISSINQKGS